MYLSRLYLDPRSRRVQSEVAHSYELHRTIMRAFPDQLDPQAERVLFRLEEDDKGGLMLLVQSRETPDWSWLGEAKGYLAVASPPNPAVRQETFELAPGQVLGCDPVTSVTDPAIKHTTFRLWPGRVLRFRLLANPTVKTKLPDPAHPGVSRPVRHGLYDDDKQQAWLQRKAEQSGFRVISVNTAKQPEVKSVIHNHAAGEEATHKLTFFAVRFDGLLEVTDVETLARTVEAGIGSGKGLGFGLLSLAPAPRS